MHSILKLIGPTLSNRVSVVVFESHSNNVESRYKIPKCFFIRTELSI